MSTLPLINQYHCSSILSGVCVSSLYFSITTLPIFYMEIIVSFYKHKFKLLHPSVKAFNVLPLALNTYSLLWYKCTVFSVSNTIFGLSHPLLAMFRLESYSNDPMPSSQGHKVSVHFPLWYAWFPSSFLGWPFLILQISA